MHMPRTRALAHPNALLSGGCCKNSAQALKLVQGPAGASPRSVCAEIPVGVQRGRPHSLLCVGKVQKTPSSAESAGSLSVGRRSAMLAVPLPLLAAAPPTLAVQDGAKVEVDPVAPFYIEDFTPEAGWTELGSGLLYKVVKKGEGDFKKGIFDKVDHFQPFPFVTVQYTAYKPNGKPFASSYADRRAWSYQVGIRDEAQDEDGAVMSMYVGERRQFVITPELAFKRKLFGNPLPQNEEAILVDVELVFLQPY